MLLDLWPLLEVQNRKVLVAPPPVIQAIPAEVQPIRRRGGHVFEVFGSGSLHILRPMDEDLAGRRQHLRLVREDEEFLLGI